MTSDHTRCFTKKRRKQLNVRCSKNMLSGTTDHIFSPIRTASYNFYKFRLFIFRYFDDKKAAQNRTNIIHIYSCTPSPDHAKDTENFTISCNTVDTQHRRNSTIRSWKNWCHFDLVINESNGAERCLWEKWPLARAGENGKVRYGGSISVRWCRAWG